VIDKSIGLFLRYAFTSRYKEILSKSHSSSLMTMPKFVPRLTKVETQGEKTSNVILVHLSTTLSITTYASNVFVKYFNLLGNQ
jgi:hypothetical protein